MFNSEQVDNPARRAFITGQFARVPQGAGREPTEVEKVLQEISIIDELSKKSSSLLSHRMSRGTFIRAAGMTAAGLVLATTLLPRAARAEEEWIDVGPEPGELNQEQWFPYDAAVARDRGLVRMHALGGPLDIHDQITGRHAREWEEDKAHSSLRKNPLKRSWLGHCDDVANVMAYHILLPVEVLGGKTFIFEGLEIDKTTVIGLQAAMHAHDLKMAYRNHPAGILALLAVGIKRGYAPVANIPGSEGQGQIWSHKIVRVRADLGRVEAYNFGRKINVSTDEIRSAYLPFHYNPNDPESYQGIDAEARAETIEAFNSELDHEVVNRITLNQQG